MASNSTTSSRSFHMGTEASTAEGTAAPTLTDLPQEVLLNIFSHLDHHTLYNLSKMTPAFDDVSGDHKLFRTLEVDEIERKVDEDFLQWLADKTTAPKKVEWSFESCDEETYAPLLEKLNTWSELEELQIKRADFSELPRIRLEQLKVLELLSCDLGSGALGPLLRSNRSLRVLKLSFPDHRTLPRLSHLGELEELDLTGVNIGDAQKFQLRQLKVLKLESCKFRSCETLATILKRMPKLQRFVLSGDNGVAAIPLMSLGRHLEHLHIDITGNSWETLREVSRISGCLKSLSLYLPSPDEDEDEFIEDFRRATERIACTCPDLQELRLGMWSHITDDILDRFVRSCPELKRMELTLLPNITKSVCLRAVRNLANLEELCIKYCANVQEKSIPALNRANDLRQGKAKLKITVETKNWITKNVLN